MSLRDELIERTLRQLAALLEKLMGQHASELMTSEEFAAAEEELDSLYLANMGSSRQLIHRLSTADLLGVLRTAGTVHAERAYVLGALLSTEAAFVAARQGPEDDHAWGLRDAALDMFLEAGASSLGEPDLQARIDALQVFVPRETWPLARFERLFRYWTGMSDYSRAETSLFEWLELAGTAQERLDVAGSADTFYSELSELSDSKLDEGGFSREEILEGKADFAERFAELFGGEA